MILTRIFERGAKNLGRERRASLLATFDLQTSGYEKAKEGMQAASGRSNHSESLDSINCEPMPPMQAEPDVHKNFGQPVVSENPACLNVGAEHELLLTPAQAAARFHVPEYVLRKACSGGRLEHLRVVNTLWLAPATVAAFAASWRVGRGVTDT